MKKRTLVCFLIFTLCIFHNSITDTAFGQASGVLLAHEVYDKYADLLKRDVMEDVLPAAFAGLKEPEVQAVLTNATIMLVVANPDILKTFDRNVEDRFVTLLKEDAALKAMLSDPLVQRCLQDQVALAELERLLRGMARTVVPPLTPPAVTTPAVTTPVAPPSADALLAQQALTKYGGVFRRPDIQAVLPAVLEGLKSPEVQPLLNADTIGLVVANPDLLATFVEGIDPGFIALLKEDAALKAMLSDPLVQELLQNPAAIAEVEKLLAAAPAVEPVAPPVAPVAPPVVEPPAEAPVVSPPVLQANPFAPLVPENNLLLGKSRLGGLELNKLSAVQFVDELFQALGIPLEALGGQELVVDEILKLVPKGLLPKKQIKQLLSSKNIRAFANQVGEEGLDWENFGNAITPMLSEVLYQDMDNRTYLTSDSLNVYTRVPSTDIGGVEFALTTGQTVAGTQLTSKVFGADTFNYTFRLEEALAATNLPTWPALENQLFSNVVLRYSQTGLNGNYIAVNMQPTSTAKGVVWETEIGVTSGSTYYYYEITLARAATFDIVDREAVNALLVKTLAGDTVQLDDFRAATKTYTIEKWAIPDPHNLQLADRGLIKQLFTPDFYAIVAKVMAALYEQGGDININQVLDILQENQARVSNILLRNTNAIITNFEAAFDPMLASVFTIPRIKPETESMWTAKFDGIADGNYYLKATVYDKAGNPLDQMQGEFTVDTNAPEATLEISPGINTSGYLNEEGVYVATAPQAGAASLNVNAGQIAGVAPGEGYLFFQELKLDAAGNPLNSWMPLTIDATMLASRVWDDALAQLEKQGLLTGDLKILKGLSLDAVLAVLTPGLIQSQGNVFLKGLETSLQSLPLNIGTLQLTEQDSKVLHEVLGAPFEFLNSFPVTFGQPNNTVKMPIQGENLPLLVGDYGVRALGIDTLFNVSSHIEPTRIRIVAPTYDGAKVTAVEDIIVYSDTTENVVLTVEVTARTVHPAGVVVQYKDATGTWQNIGEELDLSDSNIGSKFEVNWNITDFDALVAAGDSVMVRAVASNALGLSEPLPVETKIALDAGVSPVEVGVLALTVDAPTTTNVDSGGPTGSLTANAYSAVRTITDITSMRFEAKRSGDAAWVDVGSAKEHIAVTPEGDELASVLEDLAGAAAGGKAVVPVPENYLKWSVSIDTTKLEDTITADSPAARDASKDNNQYSVRAFAVTSATTETVSPLGVTAKFSVDNVDDVAPVGPTAILLVEDASGLVAPDENGAYTLGGIVDEAIQTPTATFTIQPTASKATYASVKLVQTAADGTETNIDAEAGSLKVTVDIGKLENAAYTFHALAVDSSGNVQTDKSPTSDVNVLNFRVSDIGGLSVTAVDGEAVSEEPTAPVPLRKSITVGFTVANGSLDLADLTGALLNGNEIPSESGEEPENTFSLMVDFSGLPDGLYTPNAVVKKRNGSVYFALSEAEALVHLDNTAPVVSIVTPFTGDTVDSLPTVHAKYDDGTGSGVDGATGSVGLVRILPPDEVAVDVDAAMVEKDDEKLVYTRKEQLLGGAYRVVVEVADTLGNVGNASVEFAISGTIPTVVIHSPAAGQTFEHGTPLISGEFSGAGTLELSTFTVDGNDVAATLDGTYFSYTPTAALADGEHTVAAEVTDGNGKTAKASVIFIVAIPVPEEPEEPEEPEVPVDTTPPVIAQAGPSGLIKGDSWVTISAVVVDEQSAIASVRFGIDDKPLRSVPLAQIAEGRIEVSDSFTPGTHNIKVIALSEGGSTEYSWTFTLVVDNVAPTITSITPSGTFRGGMPAISASANDESGIDKMSIVLIDSDGEEVKGSDADDGEDDVEGITRIDFIPEAPLSEGTYTIEVRATDTIGNSATAKGNFTIDFDTAAPVITMSSPQQDARLTERRPTISISFADAESGVDVDSIRLVVDDQLINLAPNQKSASQVIYVSPTPLSVGQHTVKLEVSDMAHHEGNVSEKSKEALKANMAVHEFSFIIEVEGGPVLAARPINAPNPFKDNTRISFTLNRQSTVSIVIYDITLRPVRVLVDNEVWDANEYIGKDAIGWDGTSSSGEDLARGIYFCQIMVADGFEPEYAILKLALTR